MSLPSRPRHLLVPLALAVSAAGCNPNWAPGEKANDTPPGWNVGRRQGGGSPHGSGGQAGGVDLRYHLELTFEEAALGTEKKITFEKQATCETCTGSGAKAGTKPKTCKTCRGAGQVRFNQGFFII